MILIMPMAGLGARFKEQNFTKPKPFLVIKNIKNIKDCENKNENEKPMYERAIETFTQYNIIDEVIIITLREYEEYFKNLENESKKIPTSFIFLNNYTKGQAQTCFYASEIIQNKVSKPILISACDNSAIYNSNIFKNICDNSDIVIWTFNDSELNNKTDNSDNSDNTDKTTYSWAEMNDNQKIAKITKVFTKQKPEQKPDNNNNNKSYKPIVGTFYFKNYDIFLKGYDYIYTNNIRTKNEFYIENMFNYLLECGCSINNFTVDKYIGWGIPEDYEKNKILL